MKPNPQNVATRFLSAAATLPDAPAVGDILYSSWGYDQTNIDFYEIVKVTRTQVALRKLEKKIVRSSVPYNYVVPLPGRYAGPVFRRKFSPGWRGGISVSITSYAGAHSWDGKPKGETDPRFGH